MIITVYTKPACNGCLATKLWLRRENLLFQEADIMEPSNLSLVQSLGYTSAPVVCVELDGVPNSLHWSGFSSVRLVELRDMVRA